MTWQISRLFEQSQAESTRNEYLKTFYFNNWYFRKLSSKVGEVVQVKFTRVGSKVAANNLKLV